MYFPFETLLDKMSSMLRTLRAKGFLLCPNNGGAHSSLSWSKLETLRRVKVSSIS